MELQRQVCRLVVVYNADSGVAGTLRYLVDKLLRGEGCSACALTHGAVRESERWRACVRALPWPVLQTYRDRLTPEQQRAAAGDFPCVLAERATGCEKLLGAADLGAFAGGVAAFDGALRASVEAS